MSNIRNINPESRQASGPQAMILLPGSLLTVNRVLFCLFACLMVLVVMLGFLLYPANSLLTDIEQRQHAASLSNPGSNPMLYAEVSALKGQLAGMVGNSIETKLRNLEENIRADNVSAVDLGTIQEIKNEIKMLREYSNSPAAIAAQQPDAAASVALLNNGQLLNEFSQLKFLIYVSIASCGLLIAIVGGVWLQHRYHLGHSKVERLLGKSGR